MSPFAQTAYLPQTSARPLRLRSVASWIQAHTTFLNILSLGMLILMSLMYIIQVNGIASKGYQIRDLQAEIHQLSTANQQASLEIRQAQALDRIQRSVSMIGMVPTGSVSYVTVTGSDSVAFAQ